MRELKSVNVTTDIKNLDNKITQANKEDNFQHPREATIESLAKFDPLPLVESGAQTSTQDFENYMVEFMKQKGYKGGLSPKSQIRQKIGERFQEAFNHKSKGTQCNILDTEQVTCFIWDTLCDDKELRKITDARRRYAVETPDQTNEKNDFIGGVKIIEKPYRKLDEHKRLDAKKRIDDIQEHFGVIKACNSKWQPLKGVYQRLWEDVGFKEVRMDNLRTHIDMMIKN